MASFKEYLFRLLSLMELFIKSWILRLPMEIEIPRFKSAEGKRHLGRRGEIDCELIHKIFHGP